MSASTPDPTDPYYGVCITLAPSVSWSPVAQVFFPSSVFSLEVSATQSVSFVDGPSCESSAIPFEWGSVTSSPVASQFLVDHTVVKRV